MGNPSVTADLVVVGAGAAGLATAIFCARRARGARIVCLDGAANIGAKILVSGGSRCNVTNRVVDERDFWGGSRRIIRHVLRAFPADRAAAFFGELGVPLHEEEDGKLFPDSNRSRTVLDALLREAQRLDIDLRSRARVSSVALSGADRCRFVVDISDGPRAEAAYVVLATGGRSLPKSGSDGGGYELARTFGHGCIPTTPALAPLILGDDWHESLSGVTHVAEIVVRVDGRIGARLTGSLVWTHFGASGPVMLDASRHWHRAVHEGRRVDVQLNSCPGETFTSIERWLLAEQQRRPRTSLGVVLAARLPAAVARTWLAAAGLDASAAIVSLTRESRRTVVRTLIEQPLRVVDSRGYNYAEVTAGGIPLDEIDAATMQSRLQPGLFLAGEILDVDGRLGGFNFQWAWSSGFVAGNAVADRLANGLGGDAEV